MQKKVDGFSKNPWTESLSFFHVPISWSFFTYMYIYIYIIFLSSIRILLTWFIQLQAISPLVRLGQVGDGTALDGRTWFWQEWHLVWDSQGFRKWPHFFPRFFGGFNTTILPSGRGTGKGVNMKIKLTCSNALILVFNDFMIFYMNLCNDAIS